MFGLGFGELIMIAIIAILFLGPEKLPDAMVKVAKFIKGAKKAIGDAKGALDEEMKISDLKEEALSYKRQLDEATEALNGFKNINPLGDLNANPVTPQPSFEQSAKSAESNTIATPIEPKRETITFEKKPKIPESPKGDA